MLNSLNIHWLYLLKSYVVIYSFNKYIIKCRVGHHLILFRYKNQNLFFKNNFFTNAVLHWLRLRGPRSRDESQNQIHKLQAYGSNPTHRRSNHRFSTVPLPPDVSASHRQHCRCCHQLEKKRKNETSRSNLQSNTWTCTLTQGLAAKRNPENTGKKPENN